MLVCLACYGDRVAALLENATQLRLYRAEHKAPVPCGVFPAPKNGVPAMVDMLAGMGVKVLVCGGLSGCALAALQQSGLPVVPWIGGSAAEVASAWAGGGIAAVNRMRMPGCALGGCGFRPAGRGCRHGQARKALHARTQKSKAEKSS